MSLKARQGEDLPDDLQDVDESWEWSEISLVIAAVTSMIFVLAALYLIQAHKRQWNKMQQMDEGKIRGEC